MKVNVIGCSTCWTDRPMSAYCLDDNILIDCGEGTTKNFSASGVDFYAIKKIFITHFHSDHFFGLSQFLCQHCFYNSEDKYLSLTIYGPVGLKKHLDLLKIFAFSEQEADLIDLTKYINIVEIDNFEPFKVDDYVVKPFKLVHGVMENIAYVFEKDGKTVGFSGDCTYTSNLEEFAKISQVCFLECCSKQTSKSHLGYDKFLELKNKYSSNRFLAVHSNNNLYQNQSEYDIEFAKDTTTYNF